MRWPSASGPAVTWIGAGGGMGALKLAVVVMGVLIIGGTLTLGVLLAGRMSGSSGAGASAVLDEPPGTAIAGVSLAADRLAVLLHGGGVADRTVVVDTRSGRVVARVGLR